MDVNYEKEGAGQTLVEAGAKTEGEDKQVVVYLYVKTWSFEQVQNTMTSPL